MQDVSVDAPPVSGHDATDVRSLLTGIQALLLKVQAEDGDRLSGENADLLRRATAGLGWLRTPVPAPSSIAGLTIDEVLDRDRGDRAQLMAHVAGTDLEPRAQPSPSVQRDPPTAQQLSDAIFAGTGQAVTIEGIAPIWTETSKEIFAVTCAPTANWLRDAILRREPPIAVVATSLVDEYDVLRLTHEAGLPVPRALFAEADPDVLGGRVLMLERVGGKTFAPEQIGDQGPAIVADMGTFLARLHALNPDDVPRMRDDGQPIPARLRGAIDDARAICEAGDQCAVLTAAFDWLDANFDSCATDDPAIVHGDFDLRNILITDGRLSAVLDWELSIRGHPAQDLGYCWPHVTQMGDWDQFMSAYVDAGGRPIPQRQVLFFALWSQLWRIAIIVPLWRAFYEGEHPVLLLGSLRYLEQQVYLCDLDRALQLARQLDEHGNR